MPRDEAKDIFDRIKVVGERWRPFVGSHSLKSGIMTAMKLDPKLMFEIMGSYRRYAHDLSFHSPRHLVERLPVGFRGKADCGDIDILMTRPIDDGKTHAGINLPRFNFCSHSHCASGILRHLLRELRLADIITDDLALPDSYDSLEATYRGLCRRDSLSRKRRIGVVQY